MLALVIVLVCHFNRSDYNLDSTEVYFLKHRSPSICEGPREAEGTGSRGPSSVSFPSSSPLGVMCGLGQTATTRAPGVQPEGEEPGGQVPACQRSCKHPSCPRNRHMFTPSWECGLAGQPGIQLKLSSSVIKRKKEDMLIRKE